MGLAFLGKEEKPEKLGYIVIYATTLSTVSKPLSQEEARIKLAWNPRLHSVSILQLSKH